MRFINILKIIGVILLILFVFLIIVIILKCIRRRLLIVEFKKWKKNAKLNLKKNSRFLLEHELYNDRFTCNHTHTFIIDDNGILWYRLNNSLNWKPLFWEGFQDSKIIKLSSDGCNLILIDDKGFVHYRKIIKDKRNKNGDYEWKDLLSKSNYWDPGWAFSIFPLDHFSKRLKIDPEKPCCISHRGFWNHFIIDQKSKEKFYEKQILGLGGTTTFYYFDGKWIRIADPMFPMKLLFK